MPALAAKDFAVLALACVGLLLLFGSGSSYSLDRALFLSIGKERAASYQNGRFPTASEILYHLLTPHFIKFSSRFPCAAGERQINRNCPSLLLFFLGPRR